jgi:hypothetical protein
MCDASEVGGLTGLKPVSITNTEKKECVYGVRKTQTKPWEKKYAIGLFKLGGEFIWNDFEANNDVLQMWATNHPQAQKCVYIGQGGKWFNDDCTADGTRYVLCDAPICAYVSKDLGAWDSPPVNCKPLELTTANLQYCAYMTAEGYVITGSELLWIGGKREGGETKYKWIGGAEVPADAAAQVNIGPAKITYPNWLSIPNPNAKDEFCMGMNKVHQWTQTPCNEQHRFLCKWNADGNNP